MVMSQGRVAVLWLSWVAGGACGALILLAVVCYCRLMPRQQKSLDEQYLNETNTIKENYVYSNQGNYTKVKLAELPPRPAGAARAAGAAWAAGAAGAAARPASYAGAAPAPVPQYASSTTLLDEAAAVETGAAVAGAAGAAGTARAAGEDAERAEQALKTRSLPASLRPRPLSSDTDLLQLYAKVTPSKKHQSRMRSEHAAIIALSKSRSQGLDAPAVIVYDQRTQL